MSTTPALDRRGFLRLSALAGGGLMLGFGVDDVEAVTPHSFAPNAFITITPAGVITLMAKNPDMGQGVKTSLPMLLAEELDVGLDQVRIVQAGHDAGMADQGSGGSESIPNAWEPLRRAGAAARLVLIQAAARRWAVPEAELSTERGQVLHAASGRRAAYGELADAAARLRVPTPDSIKLKPRSEFKLLGQRHANVDGAGFARGAPLFCLDQQRAGQLYAMVEKCPVFGGTARSANLAEIRRLPGVRDAFIVEGSAEPLRRSADRNHHGLQPFVAVVASSSWAAIKARRALKVDWDTGAYGQHSSAGYREQALAALQRPGEVWRNDGDSTAALAQAARRVEAFYEFPLLAHCTMEPMSCLAEPLPDGGLALTTPSQFPDLVPVALHKVLGVPVDKVRVTIPRLGGGFGRRFELDFVLEAAAIALRVGKPIKLFYSREDDMRHDFYRPHGWQRMRAGLDAQGRVTAWETFALRHAFRDPVTPKLRAGLFPARFVPNYRVEVAMVDSNVPDGPYRSPGANSAAFVTESFVDELAHAAQQDPLAFRLALWGEDRELKAPDFDVGRIKAVLRLAAEKAGWGQVLPKGRGMGIAAYWAHRGYVAHVVEVAVSPAGELKVLRVVSAVDVGPIVNRSGAEQQVQGSVIDALSSTLHQRITLEAGAVVQGNFDDNPQIRMPEVPERIEVHFIERDIPPTGLGEPALPPLPPALCNAIFAACGKRIRSLPLRGQDLSWSGV
ncbi:xanthine dehydrogenase family protein molybdopterin-binding subunit [Paucibacter sp. XJ19-41]|uniref:xanthine dehydrogenase family protein molybdopterin-binding subunit n=1 Tax=Paucibacter sp. XJ19-41 TaxID=2927824 RepID=UPI0023490706|nr:molybdopterin cofactor-binding domain-containing protein [Paucibacter sp. XJ19-41]MDC6169014.1 molybdopterin-dependent oxidoreductase [Paucibacter sp. XJ19-41]